MFQTKSLDSALLRYTITADGKLIEHTTRMEAVPEEQRPFYSTPEWEKGGLYRAMGSLKQIPTGDQEVAHHGDIYFYTSREEQDGSFEWYEYQARFTDGRLQWLKRVPRGSSP